MTDEQIKKELQTIANAPIDTIEKVVALEALQKENAITFFKELLNYGCHTGMVGSLIYYTDTHTFFDIHYHQIEELRSYFEDEMGGKIKIIGDLKNTLAWFAFEEVAYQLATKFKLDI